MRVPFFFAVKKVLGEIFLYDWGGVGIDSLEADDPDNFCGNGSYPFHRHIASQVKDVDFSGDEGKSEAFSELIINNQNKLKKKLFLESEGPKRI